MQHRFVLLTFLAIGVTVAVTSLAAAAPPGSLTEFGVPTGSVPFRIASGADGNLWFSDQGTTKAIGRMSTAGVMIDEIVLPAGSFPRQVRVGPDGNFWYTDTTTPAIGRIALDGTITQFHLAVGSFPNALAIGADGNIWFTDRGTTPAIGRITPTGAITMFSAGLNAGSLPNGITPGPGNVWFTDQGTTRAIGRVAVDGTIIEFTSGLNAGSLPAALTTGPDGNVWFTDQGTPKAIGRVTPDGSISESSAGLNVGSNPIEVTPGADGNLWFTDNGTTKAIGQVTTAGAITEFAAGLSAVDRPTGIRTGSDGNLWFVDNNTTGQAIGRFGIGAPAASNGVAVGGAGVIGAAQICDDSWNAWAGLQPSHTAFGFDGYQWRLDGNAISGETGQSYTPAAADVGHQLSCTVTVTYTLFPVTSSAASAAVTVHDATAPVLALPSLIAVNATGPNGTAVTYTATATDDVDPSPVVSCTPASGSTFSIGTTTVNCIATDVAGNSASGSFTVTVRGAALQLADLAAAVQGVGPGKSLAATVAVAQFLLARDATRLTCITLTAFTLEVRAQSGKKIPTAQASALIADANRIKAVLAC